MKGWSLTVGPNSGHAAALFRTDSLCDYGPITPLGPSRLLLLLLYLAVAYGINGCKFEVRGKAELKQVSFGRLFPGDSLYHTKRAGLGASLSPPTVL